MSPDSISAYNLEERVSLYDRDMNLMHPNRPKMIDIALEILPFSPNTPLIALDVGVGTGSFTKNFLLKFPQSQVFAVDGSEVMIELAKSRLDGFLKYIEFKIGDFRKLENLLNQTTTFDVIFSSYALHHLSPEEKGTVLNTIYTHLSPGGWFINADLIVAESPVIEDRIQTIRLEGILERAGQSDDRFQSITDVKKFINDLEEAEGDQPVTLNKDLDLMEEAGFSQVSLFWQEYREVVFGGIKN